MADQLQPANADDGTAIRDAACIIVVDHSNPEPRLLIGQRLDTQVFLPGKWVFPGGRVDDDDGVMAQRIAAQAGGSINLTRFSLAAVRELHEETGFVAGALSSGQPFEAVRELPAAWQPFAATGFAPGISNLRPVARAITPPGRVRRYDTWFFAIDRAALAKRDGLGDGELRGLDWFSVEASRQLDLPIITRLVLDDVAALLADGPLATANVSDVPFYHHDGRQFLREIIALKCDWPVA